MAKKKVSVEDIAVDEKLKSLFKLQSFLSEIDKIRTLRGELPLEVADLDDEIAGLGTRINKLELDLKGLGEKTTGEKIKIDSSQSKIARYNTQLENVRNSKEYDHLTKEVEYETLEIELAEKFIRENGEQEKTLKEKIASANDALKEKNIDLAAKNKELDDIVSETKSQEEKIREKAKKTEALIEPRLLTAFKRIRKNARNGLGIVPIQRAACGGCFNKIPPQRQMDIKLGKKVIVCEYCGRIQIDPEMVGLEVE